VKRKAEEDWGVYSGTKCGDAVSYIDEIGILIVIVLIV
jgi:hypothetical protein